MNLFEKNLNMLIDAAYAWIPQKRPSQETLDSVKIVAHRGVHENGLAIENTKEAFQLAVDHKIWGIEFDVRWTKDFIPVIHHDPDCNRLYKQNIIISESTFKNLNDSAPSILSLQNAIRLFGKKIHLLIELKEDFCEPDLDEKLSTLEKHLTPLTPEVDYHILSLTPQQLEPIQFVPKSAKMDIMWLNPAKIIGINRNLGHGSISGPYILLNQRKINELKSQGRLVGVGFISSRNSLYREIHKGVDFVFTNSPLALKESLAKQA